MNISEWKVLLVGGSSGIGKSELTKKLINRYNVKLIEADDLGCLIAAISTTKSYPALNYWFGDDDWSLNSVDKNVEILSSIGEELEIGLRAIINYHIKLNKRVIIEGDFITPKFASSFNTEVKSIFLYEPIIENIIDNYSKRESGEPQIFRANISYEYGLKIRNDCIKYRQDLIISRPFNTLFDRVISTID